MFQIGEMILYGTEGVCRILRTEVMKVGGKRKSYYVLKPVSRERATIFVPMDNQELLDKMQAVLTPQEIRTLLEEPPREDFAWIEDSHERKAAYQQILQSGNREQIVQMIRLLYKRRKRLHACGKQLRSGDDQLLREAERLLQDELSLVLEMPQSQVREYIRSHIAAD